MVNEVNNIIYNLLVDEQAVHLPGIGTLSVVRRSAQLESSDLIAPPSYVIEFSSHAVATSVVDAIAMEGSTDIMGAEDIYSRWLDKVRNGNTLSIEGVGTLRDKSFVADPAFIAMFNTGRGPVKRGSKKGGGMVALVIILILLIVAAIGATGWFFRDDISALFTDNTNKESIEESDYTSDNEASDSDYINQNNDTNDEDSTLLDEDDKDGEYTSEDNNVVVDEPNDRTTEEDKTNDTNSQATNIQENRTQQQSYTPSYEFSEDWTLRNDIRHWVVVGSYSTEKNAERAMQDILKKHPEATCKVFSLGWMYAVASYGSADRDECVKYMRKYRYDYDQMWIFTPKANR